MTDLQVYINDVAVDLAPDTVVAKTIQCFDLFNLGNVCANYTNQINLPYTDNNRKILEFADLSKSATNIPYANLSCRIVQNGFELVTNGVAVVTSANGSFLITIFDGNYNFFSLINSLYLADISLESFASAWTRVEIAAKSNSVSGIVHAFMDATFLDYISDYNVYTFDAIPSFYFKDLISSIFSVFGFSLSGNVTSDSLLALMVTPLQTALNQKIFKKFEFSAQADGTQSFVAGAGTDIIFSKVAISNSGFTGVNCYNGTSQFTVLSNVVGDSLYLNFQADINLTVAGGGTIFLQLVRNGVLITSVTLGAGTFQQTIKTTINDISNEINGNASIASRNDIYKVVVINSAGVNTVTINSGSFYCKLPAPSLTRNWLGVYHPQYHFPDLKLTDIIKEFTLLFGQLYNQVKGTVYSRNIDELINDTANAQDWTSKRDTSVQEQIVFQFGNFSQTNFFKWLNNADNTLGQDYLSGSFVVPNLNLPPQQTRNSIFNSSDMGGVYPLTTGGKLGLNCLKTKIKAASGTVYVKDIGSRLALVRNSVAAVEPSAINVRTNSLSPTPSVVPDPYKVAYFADQTQTLNLDWSAILSRSYSQFILRLQKTKMVTRSYYLSDADIGSFDPLKLVHEDGEYFIVNKIINYVPGQVTSVELLKV